MQIRLLAILFIILFTRCTKSTNTTQNTTSGNVTDNFQFSPVYDSVISVYANSTYNFAFVIKVDSGDITYNPLICSVSGLPAFTTISPSSITVTQTLGGLFTFTIGSLTTGTYKMQLIINTTKYGTQSHNIYLTIKPRPDYSSKLAGNYAGSYDFCIPPDSIYTYYSIVSYTPGKPYQVKISNIKNLGAGFVVTANVSTTVSIPVQSVSGYTIWGAGTYGLDSRTAYDTLYQLTINDTLVHGVDTQACTIHIRH